VIGSAVIDDTAEYKIEVDTGNGVVSSTGRLTVGVGAKIKLPLHDQKVPVDETFDLTCKLEGTPFPDVKW